MITTVLPIRTFALISPYDELTTISCDMLSAEVMEVMANGQVAGHVYDPAGRETLVLNRLLVTGGSTSGASPLITTYEQDQAGNRILPNAGGALTTYTWDYENRMTLCVPSTGVPLTNLYDATGLRRSDGTDSFIWDEQNLLQTRAIVGGAKAYQFVGAPATWGGAVSERNAGTGTSQFFAFDQSGNTRAASQLAEYVTANVDYLAFGNEHYLTGVTNLFHRFGGNLGYYRPTNPVSLYYIRQRWYDSLYATWLGKDPMDYGPVDWGSLYRYAENRPLVITDPLDLWSWPWCPAPKKPKKSKCSATITFEVDRCLCGLKCQLSTNV